MDTAVNLSLPTNSAVHLPTSECIAKAHISISTFIIIRSVLLFPLSLWVLHLCYQRWRQQRSFKNVTPSELITGHMVLMQLAGVPGVAVYFCGVYVSHLFLVGSYISTVSIFGELMFHLLTCVERYLAIVHPITYLGLKNTTGIMIRKVYVGCSWVLFFGWCCILMLSFPNFPLLPILCILSFSFAVVTFCSLCALCTLTRPGPGAADRERVDQSKQKAFRTIMVITAVLWLFFIGYITCLALTKSTLLGADDECLLLVSGIWFSLPSSLVVPLLFLHRSGKLPCTCLIID